MFVSVEIVGVVYGILMGALTGYFSVMVGALFSIAGIVGIIASVFHERKMIATIICSNILSKKKKKLHTVSIQNLLFVCLCVTQFLVVLVIVNLLGLSVNMAGVADPGFFATMDERNLGFIVIKPNAIWFASGIAFMIIFCVC